MADPRDFANHIVDLLESFGPVESKRMFGGYGIFRQGLMIGLVADGSFYLKADARSRSTYEDEGLTRFSYFKKDKECFLSYYQAPELFFEDSDESIRWATQAYEAALRSSRKKEPKN